MSTATLPVTEEIKALLRQRMGFIHCISAPEIPLAGSPERCRERTAIRTEKGLFVLEAFSTHQILRKGEIAACLFHLADLGLSHLLLPLKDSGGRSLIKHQGNFLQLTPHADTQPLPRPGWVRQAWRGKAFAAFLTHLLAQRSPMADFLRKKARTPLAATPFDILAYIRVLMDQIRTRRPALHDDLLCVQRWTEKALASSSDKIPHAFSHGDVHPMNVLWQENAMGYVIDWEFCGIKPEIHDTANLIGCLGSEDPAALQGPFIAALLTELARNHAFSETGWQALLPMVIAIRFCWLSEWLRREDAPMIALESRYLHLLVESAGDLHRLWLSVLS